MVSSLTHRNSNGRTGKALDRNRQTEGTRERVSADLPRYDNHKVVRTATTQRRCL